MARPLTPNAILKKRGSEHVRKNEPEFREGLGAPPERLGPVALAAWADFVEVMGDAGIVLTKMDRSNLIEYCDARQASEDAQADIDATGQKSITERGETRNVSLVTKSQAARTILNFCSAYGLTPASRGKVTVPTKPKANKFADL
jgi:P27 family predicted phage terminase small subunit